MSEWCTHVSFFSPSKVRKGSRIQEIFARGIVESWALESGIQFKEPGMLLTMGILNVSSTDKESEIQDPRRRIQNPRPSWITSTWDYHVISLRS